MVDARAGRELHSTSLPARESAPSTRWPTPAGTRVPVTARWRDRSPRGPGRVALAGLSAAAPHRPLQGRFGAPPRRAPLPASRSPAGSAPSRTLGGRGTPPTSQGPITGGPLTGREPKTPVFPGPFRRTDSLSRRTFASKSARIDCVQARGAGLPPSGHAARIDPPRGQEDLPFRTLTAPRLKPDSLAWRCEPVRTFQHPKDSHSRPSAGPRPSTSSAPCSRVLSRPGRGQLPEALADSPDRRAPRGGVRRRPRRPRRRPTPRLRPRLRPQSRTLRTARRPPGRRPPADSRKRAPRPHQPSPAPIPGRHAATRRPR